MKLPNSENAVISEAKVRDYLLSATHETGKDKAAFFTSFGFSELEWIVLADALLQHAREHEVSNITETVHGVKYVIEGILVTPDERNPRIRAIWIIDVDGTAPRLVSAYPLKEQQ